MCRNCKKPLGDFPGNCSGHCYSCSEIIWRLYHSIISEAVCIEQLFAAAKDSTAKYSSIWRIK